MNKSTRKPRTKPTSPPRPALCSAPGSYPCGLADLTCEVCQARMWPEGSWPRTTRVVR